MPEPSANLIDIYTERFAECREFDTDLGLEFVEEQHGSGPVHVAAELTNGGVFELYPASADRSTGRLRLGFTVAPTTGHEPGTYQVVDPDDRVVELRVVAPDSAEVPR